MEGFLNNTMKMETLLVSDMLGTLIFCYVFLIVIMFVSFINIYSTDEIEFLYNTQKCMEFKHRIFFIIQKSKNKNIISKKTFILELIGFLLSISTVFVGIFSLFINVDTAFILFAINAIIVIAFASIAGGVYRKVKKINYTR